MKVKINRVRGGSMGDQRDYGLITGSIWNYELKPDTNRVSDVLSPVPREEANIEAERGETIVGDLNNDGMVEHAVVGGKRHFQGGTPLNVPDGSFVFSDYNRLKIKNKDLLKGIFNYSSSKGATPATIAKRYELNKYIDILNDPESDPLDKKTAQLMMDNNMKKLGQLALVQEGMKGFPDGIPDIALPLLGPGAQTNAKPVKMKKGGLVKYQRAGQKKELNTFPYLPTPENELRQMQAQYPGNWLPELQVNDAEQQLAEWNTMMQQIKQDPNFGKKPMVTGAPADWLMPSLATGLAFQYGPKAAKATYDALRVMGMPAWPGAMQAAKNIGSAIVTGVKKAVPGAYNLVKKYPGLAGASIPIIGQEVFGIGKPAEKAFSDEELGISEYDSAPTTVVEEPLNYDVGPIYNPYQEGQQQNTQQPSAPASRPATRPSAPAAQQSSGGNREAIRYQIAETAGMDPADVTDEMIDNYKVGGTTLPIHQSRGVTGPSYNVMDKDVMDAAAAKEFEAVRPYTYYNPNIPVIGSQLTTSGKYMVTPQGVITRKGATPIDIEQLKQYPIDWASYGPGGFEDFKKDIAAAKGKESAASKWWVDTVNKYAVEKTGKPIFDISQKGVYVPGYEWSTPAYFKEKEKKAEPAKKEEAKTESKTETKTDKPAFQAKKTYGLGTPFPSDVANLIVAGSQRVPDIDVMLSQQIPSLVQPVYTNPMLESLSAVAQAAEGAGEGPAARASKLGISGKAMDAAAKIIQQNAANNQNMFLQTQAQNANILNQANAANQLARQQYLADVNNRRLYLAQQLNRKESQIADKFGDLYGNMYKQMNVNAQYPYQISTPYGVEVNPELQSISQSPLLGNIGGNNIDAIYNSKYNDFINKGMSAADAAEAASNYINAVSRYSRGTQGAAYSPFDIS